MKRTLAIVLAMLMLVATLVACAQPGDSVDTTTAATVDTTAPSGDSNTPADTTASDETTLYVEDEIPEELNFNNTTVSILYWDDVEKPEFEVLEQTGDIVNDAIYMRNLNTETRIGVDLNFVGTPGTAVVIDGTTYDAADSQIFQQYKMLIKNNYSGWANLEKAN
jgi:hypothetical protein